MTDELAWPAPGPGSWALDRDYKSTSFTRPWQELFPAGIAAGFARLGATYGLPFERLEVVYVNGYQYGRMVITGAPAPRAGRPESPPPPRLLWLLARVHPALRRRASTARQALPERRWRRDVERWEREVRPARLATNLAIQDRLDEVERGDGAALAVLVEDAAANLRDGIASHFGLLGAVLPVGRFLVACEAAGIDASAALAHLAGSSPASAEGRDGVEAIRSALAEAGATGPWGSLAEVSAVAPAVAAALTAHLRTHGHRLVGASDLDGATVLEHPDLLLRALAVRPGPGPRPDAAGAPGPAPLSDERLVGLLDEARRCYGVREADVGIDIAWPGGLLRGALLAAGAHLEAAGRLRSSAHVVELTIDEVVGLLGGGRIPDAPAVEARASTRRAADAATPPPWLGAAPSPPPAADVFPAAMAELTTALGAYRRHMGATPTGPPDGTATWHGAGIGHRSYRGVARVATEPGAVLDDLVPGDILVTTITTPAFSAVLPLLGALVTEQGGLLSHPAIAARELDLPAVVGATGVLAAIPDGATVEVDPVAGTVTLVAAVPAAARTTR